MTWKQFIYKLIVDYCNRRGNRTFTLQDFKKTNQQAIKNFRPSVKTPFNTVGRILQELRDEGLLSFVDNSGTYTLRGIDLLEGEIADDNLIKIKSESPVKKEYLIEVYTRNIGWAKEAKEKFGLYCMCAGRKNTFTNDDGIPYIEVHHIRPLCNGGEDGIWILSVLCAHHHRMAHYADKKTRKQLEQYLYPSHLKIPVFHFASTLQSSVYNSPCRRNHTRCVYYRRSDVVFEGFRLGYILPYLR